MKRLALVILGLALVAATGWTPARASVATVAGTVNIAAAANGGRIVGFSGQRLDENKKPILEWQISNLLDGKYVVGNNTPADSYGWSSELVPTEEKPEWFIVGFTTGGKDVTHLISRVVVDPNTDDPPEIGRRVRGITVEVSTTGKDGPWTEVGKYIVVDRAVKQTFDFPPTEARYVRVLITSNHGSNRCVDVGEFEVYEAIIPAEQLDELIVRLENVLNDLKRYRDGQLYKANQANTEAVTKPTPSPTPAAPATTPAAPTTATPPTPATPATPEVATTPPQPAPVSVDLGVLSLVLPTGWTKDESCSDAEGDLKLVLRGPQVGGNPLILTASVETLAPQTSLAAFATALQREWPRATLSSSKDVKLAGIDARYLIFTWDTWAYLTYCVVHNDKGVALTAVTPSAATSEAEKALEPLYASVKLS